MQIKIIAAVGLLVMITGFFVLRDSQPVPEVRNNTIVWLGDSIGEGYGATEGNSPPEYLARQLGLPVINASRSGDTTKDGVAKIEAVLAQEPGLVIVQLGGNDALRKLPEDVTEENLDTMVSAFLTAGSAVAVVGIRSGPFGDRYGGIFEDLVAQYNVVYIPDALKGLFGDTRYMFDPIHPNDAGSEILAERVFDAIWPIYK